MAVDIGKLRHRVAIQTVTSARRAGSYVNDKTRATVATVWGRVEPLTGRELETAQRVQAQATVKITVRYYSGLDPTYRFVYNSRNFNILDAGDPEERGITMVCLCEEVKD